MIKLIYNNINRFKTKFNIKYIINYHFLIKHGLQFGGHRQNLNIRTSSLIFGQKESNLILNMNLLILELKKVNKIIEGLSFKRGVIYLVNSYLGLNLRY